MNKLQIALILSGSLLLVGCNEMPPACDSDDTKSSLKKIISTWIGIDNPTIINPTQVNEDQETERYFCNATIAGGKIAPRTVNYTVSWKNKKERYFYVQITN